MILDDERMQDYMRAYAWGFPLAVLGGLATALLLDTETAVFVGVCAGAGVGMLARLCWYLLGHGARDSLTGRERAGIGVLGVAVCVFSVFQWLEINNTMDRISELRSLRRQDIAYVAIYDSSDGTQSVLITDPEALEDFASSCRDVGYYFINHPSAKNSWDVLAQGGKQVTFEGCYVKGVDEFLYGYMTDEWESNLGTFKSVRLRAWFDQYVLPLEKQQRSGKD